MTKYDVIVFGSAVIDTFLASPDFKLVEDGGKVAICQTYGEKFEVEKRLISGGGGGTNVSVGLSRLGLKVAISARLGNDLLGQMVIDELKKEKVATDFLVPVDEETDSATILVGPDGGRTILVYRGKTYLKTEDVDWSQLNTDWFYLTSLEGNLDLVEKLLVFAKEHRINVAWNPGRKELAKKEKVKNLANLVKVFDLNKEEMEELLELKTDQPEFWPMVKELGSELIVVTDGRNGAYLLSEIKPYFLSTPTIKPVDETGAGDAFGSAFVYGLVKKMKLEEAFKLAMKNGASVAQHLGAKEGLLRADQIY